MTKVFPKAVLALSVAVTSYGIGAAELEEVLVTAQKRTESLQDVPISVTAISGEFIEDASIRSFGDLSGYVPNFSVTENAVNTIITMRGISVGAQQSFEQSVGVFLDGVYLGRSRQLRLGLFDLEQVEVLRGPQGILFGKNTLGGAVNVRSAAPVVGEGLSGRVAASFESDNGEYFEGHVSGSVSENVAMRLSIMDRSVDGYLDNTAPTAAYTDSPTTDETIARIGLQWEPSESTAVGVRYTYADYKRIGSNSVVTQLTPTFVDSTGDGVRNQPYVPSSNLLMYGVMALLDVDFNPANLIVLPLILHFVARRNPYEYARALSPALLTAFSSASSNGTLPLTMACVENRARIDNKVSSFVLPLGATINMDGTALYEAVAVLFIGQLYHGAVLPLEQQLIVAFTALLASVGAAGIPHAGLVMMVVILQAVGLPVEMQGIILAVDRVLDMCRTSVNVWSDSCGCAVVASLEARAGVLAQAESAEQTVGT